MSIKVTQTDKTTASQQKTAYQEIIDSAGHSDTIVAKDANLLLFAAFIIPTARQAEFDGATQEDQAKFAEVSKNALNRPATDGDFVTLFEEEYIKIFG